MSGRPRRLTSQVALQALLAELEKESSEDEAGIEDESSDGEMDNVEQNSDHDDEIDGHDAHDPMTDVVANEEHEDNSTDGDIPPPSKKMKTNPGLDTKRNLEKIYKAKSERMWSTKQPNAAVRTTAANLLRQKTGVTSAGKISSIGEAFSLFITDEMLDIIIRETNRYAMNYYRKKAEQTGENAQEWTDIDIIEMKATIGMLLHAGKDKSSKEALRALFAPDSKPFYRSAMNVNRFHNILRFMRMDDVRTRSERTATDKLAPIRNVWDMLNARLAMMYLSQCSLLPITATSGK